MRGRKGGATRCFGLLLQPTHPCQGGLPSFQKGPRVPVPSWKPHNPPSPGKQFRQGLHVSEAVTLSTGKFCLTFY